MITIDGQLSLKMHTELDITFLGLKVLKIGILVVEDPNQVLDKTYQTKLPSIVGWILIQLSYNAFVIKYGTLACDSFVCPKRGNSLLFSQLFICYYFDMCKNYPLGANNKTVSIKCQQ